MTFPRNHCPYFFAEFCAVNGILGFGYSFAGMQNPKYNPSGFDEFENYLPKLASLNGFSDLTDLILVCDSAQNPGSRFTRLCTQINRANTALGTQTYTVPAAANVHVTGAPLRVHALVIPFGTPGGLESVCVNVARDHLNTGGTVGTQIEGWVDGFANNACTGWTVEKRDKLRLQAFISAASKKKPDMHFSQLFDITGNHLIPLTSPSFNDIRTFLRAIEAL